MADLVQTLGNYGNRLNRVNNQFNNMIRSGEIVDISKDGQYVTIEMLGGERVFDVAITTEAHNPVTVSYVTPNKRIVENEGEDNETIIQRGDYVSFITLGGRDGATKFIFSDVPKIDPQERPTAEEYVKETYGENAFLGKDITVTRNIYDHEGMADKPEFVLQRTEGSSTNELEITTIENALTNVGVLNLDYITARRTSTSGTKTTSSRYVVAEDGTPYKVFGTTETTGSITGRQLYVTDDPRIDLSLTNFAHLDTNLHELLTAMDVRDPSIRGMRPRAYNYYIHRESMGNNTKFWLGDFHNTTHPTAGYPCLGQYATVRGDFPSDNNGHDMFVGLQGNAIIVAFSKSNTVVPRLRITEYKVIEEIKDTNKDTPGSAGAITVDTWMNIVESVGSTTTATANIEAYKWYSGNHTLDPDTKFISINGHYFIKAQMTKASINGTFDPNDLIPPTRIRLPGNSDISFVLYSGDNSGLSISGGGGSCSASWSGNAIFRIRRVSGGVSTNTRDSQDIGYNLNPYYPAGGDFNPSKGSHTITGLPSGKYRAHIITYNDNGEALAGKVLDF